MSSKFNVEDDDSNICVIDNYSKDEVRVSIYYKLNIPVFSDVYTNDKFVKNMEKMISSTIDDRILFNNIDKVIKILKRNVDILLNNKNYDESHDLYKCIKLLQGDE